jgi:hypothetical protein
MNQKKRKLKIQTNKKQYSLTDSCFYKLQSKQLLAKLLKTELSSLQALISDDNYNCYTDLNGVKPRDIEHPYFNLDKVQTRIASLVCRIEQPNYIHSGVKGRSHKTNAEEHIGDHHVLTSDIQSFFPSTTVKMVFRFFHKRMGCSPDVSNFLAGLCTCKGHIPTGSRISMPLAFWANEPMFDQLHRFAVARDVTFTVFVDDIVFSGNSIDQKFLYNIKKIISACGHTAHSGKTKLHKAGKIKVVTGVAVGEYGLHVANKHRKNIYQDLSQWKVTEVAGVQIKDLNGRVIGRMTAQALVDYRFKDKARTLKVSIKKNSASNVEQL